MRFLDKWPFTLCQIILVLLSVALQRTIASDRKPPTAAPIYKKNYLVLLNERANLSCPFNDKFFFEWHTGEGGPGEPLADKRDYIFKADSVALSGTYKCVAVNGFGRTTVKLNLKVLDLTSPTIDRVCTAAQSGYAAKGPCFMREYTDTQLSLEFNVGDQVKLDCEAGASDPLVYSWQVIKPAVGGGVQGAQLAQDLDDQRSQLVIEKVDAKANGEYRCVVTAGGRRHFRTFKVTVREAAVQLIIGPRITNQSVAYGERALLSCEAERKGFKYLQIEWGKSIDPQLKPKYDQQSKVLEYGNELYVLLESTTERSTDGQRYYNNLLIRGVTDRDSGKYVCTALTSEGGKVDKKFIHLHVIKGGRFVPQSERGGRANMILYIAVPLCILLLCAGVIVYCLVSKKCHRSTRAANGPRHHPIPNKGSAGSNGSGSGALSTGPYPPPSTQQHMVSYTAGVPVSTGCGGKMKPGSGNNNTTGYNGDHFPVYPQSEASHMPVYYSGGMNGGNSMAGGGHYNTTESPPTNGFTTHHYPT